MILKPIIGSFSVPKIYYHRSITLIQYFILRLIDGEKVGYIKLNYSSAQTEFKDEDGLR